MSSVFTPPFPLLTRRAPGVLGGKFLQRGRVKKPGQELFKIELSEYYKAQDLYVGATLCLSGNHFQVLDADECTFNYMEQHAEEVSRAIAFLWFAKVYAGFRIKGFGPTNSGGLRGPP